MKWFGVVAVVLAGCSIDLDYEKTTLGFDVVSPAAPGGGSIPIAAAGKVVYTGFISKDDGANWAGSNPAIIPTSALAVNDNQLIVNTTAFGWGRWDMTTDQVLTINTPLQIGVLKVHQSTGTILTYLNTATIGRQTAQGVWSMPQLPPPSTGTFNAQPSIYDIAMTADMIIIASDWGTYRSGDDGASWGQIDRPAGVHRLVALDDGRVAVLDSQATTITEVIDAAGAPQTITSVQFPGSGILVGGQNQPPLGCLGAIVFGTQYSTDLGQTWHPILPVLPGFTPRIAGYTCGGDYLALYMDSPSKWLMKIKTLGQFGSLYTYSPDPASAGAGAYLKLADGTVLSYGLAWKPGDGSWSIAVLPDGYKLFALADNSIFGAAAGSVTRSTDGGATFTTTPSPTVPAMADRFVSDSTGTVWASFGLGSGGGDQLSYQAKLWKSDDHGVTWTQIYDKTATSTDAGATVDMVAARLFAIAPDGTFIGTYLRSGLAVSHDQGATWEALPFPSPYQLELITPSGAGVTFDDNDDQPGPKAFHLWREYGLGNAYKQVTTLVPTDMGDMPADLSSVLSTMSIDKDGFMWWYGGATLQGVWKSKAPLD